MKHLDHKSFNLDLQIPNLTHQITRLVGGDTGRDNGPANTAGTTKGGLGGDVDVWNVFIFSQKR